MIDCTHVTNISTKKEKKSEGSRLSKPIQGKNRPKGACTKETKRTSQVGCLDLMLPKKNRADTKTVENIFKVGRSYHGPTLHFRFIKEQGDSNSVRISVIAPKSVSKLAVKRNSLRRLGYSVIKKYLKDFPDGTRGVFIFKKYEKDVSILENEVKNILDKLN
jgi:ribonuclease P protein component